MNAAFLLMSTAALAGADPVPAPPAAPAVISTGHGCNNCAPATCCEKAGLLDKIKARLGSLKHKSRDCGCAPAPAPAPCHTCAKGIADRPNLFDKLKARWGSHKACGCAPACDPCASAPAPAPAGGGTAPKEMPKPKDTPKVDPKPKGNVAIPAPLPPVTGASGTSPY